MAINIGITGYIEVFQYYQTNNNLLNIVIWKYFLI